MIKEGAACLADDTRY